jgi:hypothetical protein
MWRTLASLTVLMVGGTAHAQTVPLAEAPLPKSCFRVELTMDLTGRVSVQQEGKTIHLKQAASARHEFLERVLEAKDGVAEKTARLYRAAEANITIDTDVAHRALRADRTLMIAQRARDQLLTYCPTGLLTHEEKELTEHFDTLAVPGLLPGKETAVGASWTVPTNVVLALCDLEGLVSGNLTGKLTEIKGDMAQGTVDGIVKGIGMGAQVTMEVKARYAFDLKEKRIIALEWKQHDERLQGPVNPALTADVAYMLKRVPILEPNELNNIALVRALSVSADKMSAVVYRDPRGRFELTHGRNWHLVGEQDKYRVYRLLSERGDFVAQATLAPYTKEAPGKMTDLDEFVRLTAQAPGWDQDETLLEKNANVDVPGENGLKVYRVGATGKLGGVAAIQYFHLVAGPGGDQLIVTFTMDPKQAPNLSPHDLTLIRGIRFLDE